MQRIVKWLAPLLLCFAGWLPLAQGQNVPRAAATPEGEKEERVPGMQYVVALLFTMLVLVIICMPSRKPAYQ